MCTSYSRPQLHFFLTTGISRRFGLYANHFAGDTETRFAHGPAPAIEEQRQPERKVLFSPGLGPDGPVKLLVFGKAVCFACLVQEVEE